MTNFQSDQNRPAAPLDATTNQSQTSPGESQENEISDEPELALEPDLLSDGHDVEDEAMIPDLPQRAELSEPVSPPDQTTRKP